MALSLRSKMSPQAYLAAKTESLKARVTRRARSEPLDLMGWMWKRRAMLAPGRPFDLTSHQYLAGIYADDCQEMVLYKAGQVGISEYLISWILWMADERRATGLYVFPTDTHVSDFSAARLGPAIERDVSPYLADLIVSASRDSRGADRVGLKRVRDRFIYFRGAKVQPDGRAAQLRSIDADAEVLDELDEMDRRAPPIARQRLGHSAFKAIRQASTPTYANFGIHAQYLLSDQRAWHIQCGGCGERQSPGLEALVIEWDDLGRPTEWHERDGAPFLACRKCGEPLDRTGPGQWVAANPDRPVHGYHVSGLFAAQKDLADVITGLQSTDETERQQVFNQNLGLTYRSSAATALTDAVLDACRRDFGTLELARGETVCGVDVGRLLHVVIRGRAQDGSRPLRYAGTVPSFDEVAYLLARHKVRACVVDALPETQLARDFRASQPAGRVWLAYYNRTATKDEAPSEWIEAEGVVNMDRTRTLDSTFALFTKASRGERGNTLPAYARDIADYYKQLKAPERQLRKAPDGNLVPVYVESGSDHYAHAENYCNTAEQAPVSSWEDVSGLGQVEEFKSRWT